MNNNELYSKLWRSCNALRGIFDPSEYKYVILTIIFVKFASDTYEKRKSELGKNITDQEEIELTLLKEKWLRVPNGYSWSDLIKKINDDDLPYFFDELLGEFEKINNKLTSLWRGFSNRFIKPETRSNLSKILIIFQNHNFGDNLEDYKDTLGNCYEYFLKQFGETAGKKAGEFYTPKTIVELMVQILTHDLDNIQHKNITVYDPTAGSGGMFIQSHKFMKNKNIHFSGQELNDNTYVLAIMNLSIRGLSFDLGNGPGDTLYNDLHKNRKFDIVIANPPFNFEISDKKRLVSLDDDLHHENKRWVHGIPKEKKANYFFLQHMISKMNENGLLAVLLDNGSQTANSTQEIRESILKSDLYEAVIELPQNIFYGTGIQATLYILNKNKIANTKNKILFIDSKDNYTKSGIINELSEDNIKKVINTYINFKKGKNIDIEKFAIVKHKEEVIKNDSILSPRRYIRHDVEVVDHEKEYKKAINEIKENISDITKEFNTLLELLEKNKDY